MNLQLEPIIIDPRCSFRVTHRLTSGRQTNWHYHPEFELSLVESKGGLRYVGDSVEHFDETDLVLLGPNLPHCWKPDTESADDAVGTIVVHFRADFAEDQLWARPELRSLGFLFANAAQGINFSGASAEKAGLGMRALATSSGPAAVANLLLVLEALQQARARPLAGPQLKHPPQRTEDGRMARVQCYLKDHFQQPLSLAEVAEVAAMSRTAFSRYFRQASGNTFSDALANIRVDYAARCLLNSHNKITSIALESGFETLSSFNRHFLRVKKLSPRRYRQMWNGSYGASPGAERSSTEDHATLFHEIPARGVSRAGDAPASPPMKLQA